MFEAVEPLWTDHLCWAAPEFRYLADLRKLTVNKVLARLNL